MTPDVPSPIPVRFAAQGGEECAGDLWLPDAASAAAPVATVVLGHGLGAVRAMGLAAYAERFVAAGYAALTFDYRHWAGSSGEPRALLSPARREEDFVSALAFVRSRPELDSDRVVAWGSSMGGGHVLGVMAGQHGFAAGIAQCPFTDGPASALGLAPVSSLKVSARALVDLAGSVVGRGPVLVDAAGRSGQPALMTAADALPGYDRLLALAPEHDGKIAARAGLRIPLYRPGSRLRRIDRPTLLCISEADTVAPTGTARRQVARAKNAQLTEITYAFGHFDFYFDEPFEQVVADQLAFLQRVVGDGN